MAERILLFGGTFDPVHFGHLIVARAVAEAIDAARVVLIPAGGNPLKEKPLAPPADRLAMLKLATKDDELFEVCDAELRRRPPSFTIDTVEELLRQHKTTAAEFSLLIGADTLGDLPKWRRVDELLGLVRLAVAARPPISRQDTERALSALADKLPRPTARPEISIVPAPLIDISSNDIRRRQAGRQPIRYLLPEPVRNYIIEKNLYSGAQ